MKDNNNNNSSSFNYSKNLVYPNVNNLNKNDDLITNDCISNNSNNVSDVNNKHSDNDNGNNINDKEKVSDINSISKEKQNITKMRKKKTIKDNNKFGVNGSNKETKRNSKLKPKTNDSTSKNVKTANAKETVFILWDSIVKKVNGFLLTRNINHKYLVKVRSFVSVKVSFMNDHVEPTLRDFNPEHIIIHVGTNDLNIERTASQIAKSIVDLCQSLKTDTSTTTVFLMVPRYDNFNNKSNEVNGRLINMCKKKTSHALIVQIQFHQKDN